MEHLSEMILATGALGVASFGIVDGLKWTFFGTAGFKSIMKLIRPAAPALAVAYGDDFEDMLREQYRDGRDHGVCRTTIRQGIRIGINSDNANQVIRVAPVVNGHHMVAITEQLEAGNALSPEQESILGRFELALDSRLDAAFGKASTNYRSTARCGAGLIAIAISLATAGYLAMEATADGQGAIDHLWLRALIVGFVAIPLAPVSKDLAGALASAGKALKRG